MNEDDDRRIRDFVHDIRNPISVMVGLADLLKNKPERLSEEKRKEVIDSLHRNSERLRALVDEFAAERKRRLEDG